MIQNLLILWLYLGGCLFIAGLLAGIAEFIEWRERR